MVAFILKFWIADGIVFYFALLLQLAEMINHKDVFVIDADLTVGFDVGMAVAKPRPERVDLLRVGEDVLDALEATDLELFRLTGNHLLVKGHEQGCWVQHYGTSW